jgi:FkbM family methyltransferase
MFLVTPILNAVAYLRGPVAQHRLLIDRELRWGKGEVEWRVLDHLVDPTRAAIDVGANVGIYTGRLAQLVPKVHAFEPIPWLADDVVRKTPKNVVMHRVALSNRTGQAELRIPIRQGVEEDGLTTMENHNLLPDCDDIHIVKCEVDRMDNIICEPIGFIKIDVEGHEISVLEGAIATIRANRPILLVESDQRHNPAAPGNVFEFLRAEGYTVLSLDLDTGVPRVVGVGKPPDGVVNYIFIPQAGP